MSVVSGVECVEKIFCFFKINTRQECVCCFGFSCKVNDNRLCSATGTAALETARCSSPFSTAWLSNILSLLIILTSPIPKSRGEGPRNSKTVTRGGNINLFLASWGQVSLEPGIWAFVRTSLLVYCGFYHQSLPNRPWSGMLMLYDEQAAFILCLFICLGACAVHQKLKQS